MSFGISASAAKGPGKGVKQPSKSKAVNTSAAPKRKACTVTTASRARTTTMRSFEALKKSADAALDLAFQVVEEARFIVITIFMTK